MHEIEDDLVERAVKAFEALCVGSLAGPELGFDEYIPTPNDPVAWSMFENVVPAERFERSHA